MYDVIIAGARCSGAPTAMLLARKGYRVLMVDKASFPSDTISSHFIHVNGIARLQRWGILERIAASNCPAVNSFRLDFGPIVLKGHPVPYDGNSSSYGPRRMVLDKILIEAAVEAGTQFRDNFTVDGLCFENNRVTGVRGHGRDGAPATENAHLVIGADGVNSAVAREVKAEKYNEKPSVACAYYTYWSGLAMGGAELYVRDGRFIVAFPTNDGLVCNLIEWPSREFPALRSNIEKHFLSSLELAPGLLDRVQNAARAERFYGMGELPNFFRRSHGPGWALVGDAGYHKDPNGAHGISDAFRDAERLAEAIDSGFSGKQSIDAALEEYEMGRNEISASSYEMNFQLATMQPPPPELQLLLAALQGNQFEINRFISAITGSLPVPEFFNPDNMQRIVREAGLAPDSQQS